MINCLFNEPKTFDGSIPETKQDFWQYSEVICEIDYISPIAQDDKSFFLDNTITLGDFLIVAFLIILFVGFSLTFIRDFTKNRKLERL
jgi:hypothetical protein